MTRGVRRIATIEAVVDDASEAEFLFTGQDAAPVSVTAIFPDAARREAWIEKWDGAWILNDLGAWRLDFTHRWLDVNGHGAILAHFQPGRLSDPATLRSYPVKYR